jgi:hypothetical protein
VWVVTPAIPHFPRRAGPPPEQGRAGRCQQSAVDVPHQRGGRQVTGADDVEVCEQCDKLIAWLGGRWLHVDLSVDCPPPGHTPPELTEVDPGQAVPEQDRRLSEGQQ